MDDYQRELILGNTTVYLNGNDCSTQECNLGNLITDSMIYFYDQNYNNNLVNRSMTQTLKLLANHMLTQEAEERRDVIALINSQIIVNSIGNVTSPQYYVTKVSLDKMFGGRDPKLQIVIIRGKTIRQLLEDYYQRSDLFQVSALRVSYDRCQPINHTIIEISVKCRNCLEDNWNQLNDTKLYEVLLPQSIQINEYNDSFEVEKDISAAHVLQEYIRQTLNINTTIENRIQFIDGMLY